MLHKMMAVEMVEISCDRIVTPLQKCLRNSMRATGSAPLGQQARHYALVASIPSALDRTWVLANGAIRSGVAGNARDAGSLISQAQAQSITDRWARAQEFAKVATTMVSLAQ